MISDWFEKTISETNYRLLLNSLIAGDVDTFSQIFQEFLASSVSFFDVSAEEPEKIYHAFILGMLIGLKDRYEVKSNRESGYGRYDVMLIPRNQKDLGIVMEFKKIGRFEKADLETAVESALKQIEERQYDTELRKLGVSRILHLGFAFEGKKVVIRSKFKS
ncbi:MAG TPA: PD-(D/E)XK nuclease domain-containing protein [Waddliaceae bacterium]